MRRPLELLILLLALAGRLAAQPGELRFERLAVEDGLSHGAVWSIVQDSRGFLWVGTQDGLNRYDGYGFMVYRHHPRDPDSLSESEVLALAEDGAGGLWVGTRGGGLDRFHRAEERFEHFRHDAEDPASLGHDSVWSLLVDRSGALWVGTEDGLNCLPRPGTGAFVRYPNAAGDAAGLSGRTVMALHEDEHGALWIGTDGGLGRLDAGRRSLVTYRHDPADPTSLSRGAVRAIQRAPDGGLWVGTVSALSRWDPRSETFTHFRHDPADPASLSDGEIRALRLDRRDRLWIGTETGGLNRLDPATGAFAHFRHDPASPRTLSGDSIISIFEDRTGVLWLGSYHGLNKHDPASERFVTYRQRPGHEQTLGSRAIWPILEDRSGALWVGTYESGLDRIDRRRGTVEHYQPDPRDPESMPHGTVSSLWEDRSGVLWVGTWGGLARFDPARERLKSYRHDPQSSDSLRSDMVVSLREDSSGRFWVGTLQGLHRFDRASERFIRYPHRPSDPGSLGQDWIYSIYEDRAGDLWFGALGGGLYRLPRAAERFARYRHDSADHDSLSSDKVASLYQDRSGRLWVGTFGGGLNRLTGNGGSGSGRFVHYREEDGLPNNTVLGILEDDDGHLWLSTNGGLSRLDPEAETFLSYDVDDGLQGNVFSPGSCFRGAGGEMFFGGIEGLNSFFPDRMSTDPHPPPVVITDFQLFNESATLRRHDPESPLERSILETSKLELSHRHPVISFEFAALHFAKPRKNRYAYRLEGFDRNWVTTDAERRFARYTNLTPGRYTFKVRGSNGDGIWSPEAAELEIVVRPPTWRAWWAYGLYALALSAAFGGYLFQHRREVAHERAINRRLQAADAVKEQLIGELGAKNAELERFTYTVSHDLKTPLVTIQGFLGFVRQDAAAGDIERLDEDIRRIDGAVQKMRALLEELLDLSRVGRLMNAPQEFSFGDLVREAEELLAGRIEESGARIETASDLPNVFGDRARLFQVVQNLLENAIKYSDGVPEIEIGTRPCDPDRGDPAAGAPIIVFRDRGIGIDAENLDKVFGLFQQLDSGHEGTGVGLALVRRIVEVHGGRIWAESEGRGHGTRFCFTLPARESGSRRPGAGPEEGPGGEES